MGNIAAFEQLYINYNVAMYNICLKMIGNKQCAEDMLHDVFVIASKKLCQLKNNSLFGGWLKRITINECIKYCKKNWLHNNIEEHHLYIEETQETSWWHSIHINTIYKAINELPNGCRQIFYLYAIENFGHKEIAKDLNITEGTSKSQYSRAKKLLQEKLKPNF